MYKSVYIQAYLLFSEYLDKSLGWRCNFRDDDWKQVNFSALQSKANVQQDAERRRDPAYASW